MSGWFASLLDTDGTNGWRAEQCLRRLDELTGDDLARPELMVGAQTFALLSVADFIADLAAVAQEPKP